MSGDNCCNCSEHPVLLDGDRLLCLECGGSGKYADYNSKEEEEIETCFRCSGKGFYGMGKGYEA